MGRPRITSLTDKKLIMRMTDQDILNLNIIMKIGKFRTITEALRYCLLKHRKIMLQPHTAIE